MTSLTNDVRRIAFLGTGLMGAPMVRRLAAAGYQVTVWNRTAERAAPLADVARVVATLPEAVRDADAVIAMLTDGPATRAVLGDAMAHIRAGAVVVDMGSVDPQTDRTLAEQAGAAGIGFLDAPVSGGVVGAEAGTLSIFVGGDASPAERLAPVFAALGRATHMGPVGAGQATKLANQLIVATTIGAVAEGLRLAEAAGCDPATVRAALRGGFADSRILELHGDRMVRGDFAPGGRSASQLKDVVNALDLADRHRLHLPLARTVAGAFDDLVRNHQGADLDHSAYYLWLGKRQRQTGGVTRSAIFQGRILPGQEDAFYRAVDQNMVPAWKQMLHAQAVRVYRPLQSEPGSESVFLVQQIDYPSHAAMAEALASPRRQAATEAMQIIRPMYEGFHHHIIYEGLDGH